MTGPIRPNGYIPTPPVPETSANSRNAAPAQPRPGTASAPPSPGPQSAPRHPRGTQAFLSKQQHVQHGPGAPRGRAAPPGPQSLTGHAPGGYVPYRSGGAQTAHPYAPQGRLTEPQHWAAPSGAMHYARPQSAPQGQPAGQPARPSGHAAPAYVPYRPGVNRYSPVAHLNEPQSWARPTGGMHHAGPLQSAPPGHAPSQPSRPAAGHAAPAYVPYRPGVNRYSPVAHLNEPQSWARPTGGPQHGGQAHPGKPGAGLRLFGRTKVLVSNLNTRRKQAAYTAAVQNYERAMNASMPFTINVRAHNGGLAALQFSLPNRVMNQFMEHMKQKDDAEKQRRNVPVLPPKTEAELTCALLEFVARQDRQPQIRVLGEGVSNDRENGSYTTFAAALNLVRSGVGVTAGSVTSPMERAANMTTHLKPPDPDSFGL